MDRAKAVAGKWSAAHRLVVLQGKRCTELASRRYHNQLEGIAAVDNCTTEARAGHIAGWNSHRVGTAAGHRRGFAHNRLDHSKVVACCSQDSRMD